MAFEFKGTFTKSQFDRFETYLRAQIQQVDQRVVHLEAERDRMGTLTVNYDDGGVPLSVEGDSNATYCGKLFGVYEALGGDAFFDLQVRATSQPVFRLTADETTQAQLMSNGEVIARRGLSDAESADLVERSKTWIEGDLDYRRGFLERKIRRAIDYAEQLQLEINTLKAIVQDETVDGSLDFLMAGIQTLAADRQYTAVTNDGDQASDPHGKFARAPVAAYMPGGDGAEARDYERTLDGLVKPGGSS